MKEDERITEDGKWRQLKSRLQKKIAKTEKERNEIQRAISMHQLNGGLDWSYAKKQVEVECLKSAINAYTVTLNSMDDLDGSYHVIAKPR